MYTGLYFGTFNPVHIGHLVVANHILENTDLEQMWLVVTPQNPHKVKQNLLGDHHRMEMVYKAIEPFEKLRVSNIEFQMSRPNYTTHTLVRLREKYPKRDFALIMGYDNLKTLHKWKNYEVITSNHNIFVYPRYSNEQTPTQSYDRVAIIRAPIIELSSSLIREQIRLGHSVKHLMPEKAWRYLDEMNFYKP